MRSSTALKTEADTGNGWKGFRPGDWQTSINVRDFIVRNVTPYNGNEDFLAGASQRTKAVWAKLQPYFADERKKGVLAVDAKTPSTLLAHKAGYIDRDNEVIVGLQTDQPFKRAIFPYGGLRMVEAGLKAAGFEADPAVHEAFTKYRKSHNDGVFDAYTPEIMNCRRSGIITGLPDAYGRGRIIGDYRRVALYGVDRLIEAKQAERAQIDDMWPTDEIIRMREELADQIRALKDLAAMAQALRPRHLEARQQRPGSVPMDLFRLSRRDQGGQRRGDVDRPHLELPRHLHRARPEGRRSRRGAGAGAVGPAGAEAAHRAFPAHARLRRAVQRRSLLGDRMRRRHGSRRPRAGDQEQLPHAAHALQSGPGAGAEYHGALVEPHAGAVQALLRQSQQGHVVAAIRERRSDAAVLGRRLRHRLLRLGDAAGQADAVLRRPREPRESAALRDQRRPRRGLRRSDRAADTAGRRRLPRL